MAIPAALLGLIPKVAGGAITAASVVQLLELLGIKDLLPKKTATSRLLGSGQNIASMGATGDSPTAGYQPKQSIKVEKPSGEKITIKTEGSPETLTSNSGVSQDIPMAPTGAGNKPPGTPKGSMSRWGKAGVITSAAGVLSMILMALKSGGGSNDNAIAQMMAQKNDADDTNKQLRTMMLMMQLQKMQQAQAPGAGGDMFSGAF